MGKANDRVTYQKEKGYKKCVGKSVGKDGNTKPKIWWLGDDETRAKELASAISTEWIAVQMAGAELWPQEAVQRIETFRNRSHDAAQEAATSFYQAIEQFKGVIRDDPNRKTAWKINLCHRLDSLKPSLRDVPLSQIQAAEVRQIVNYFARRPNARQCRANGEVVDTGRPISIETAKNMVRAARQFFGWMDLYDIWRAPRRFDDLFNVNWNRLRTAIERMNAANPQKHFTVEDLATLMQNANGRMATLILLGLNCGFTQIDCAELLVGEIRTEQDQWVVKRCRGKTDVYGEWVLWPETMRMLQTHCHIGDRLANKRCFSTSKGNPLVWFTPKQRMDSVQSAWRRLIIETQVQKLGFKYLRKTGSQLVRDIGGREISEAFLAHTDPTVGRHYNNPLFTRLGAVLNQVHERLAPMLNAIRTTQRPQISAA